MIPRAEPFRVRGTYVGAFDAMSCPVCGYYYFTDKDYDLALEQARFLGLVGPVLPFPRASVLPEVRSDFILTPQVFELEVIVAGQNSFVPKLPDKGQIRVHDESDRGSIKFENLPELVPAEVTTSYETGGT